jgi:hypothetical protein
MVALRNKRGSKTMSMSKRDFVALADALRREKPGENWNPNKRVQWELDVKAIADVCAVANPRFKRERWMSYIAGECGPNGGRLRTDKAKRQPAIVSVEQVAGVPNGND